jgi:hypothetical protein
LRVGPTQHGPTGTSGDYEGLSPWSPFPSRRDVVCATRRTAPLPFFPPASSVARFFTSPQTTLLEPRGKSARRQSGERRRRRRTANSKHGFLACDIDSFTVLLALFTHTRFPQAYLQRALQPACNMPRRCRKKLQGRHNTCAYRLHRHPASSPVRRLSRRHSCLSALISSCLRHNNPPVQEAAIFSHHHTLRHAVLKSSGARLT